MSSRIIRAGNADAQKATPFRFSVKSNGRPPAAAPPAPPKAVVEEPLPARSETPSPRVDAATAEDQAELVLIRASMRAAEIEKEAYEKGFREGRQSGAEGAEERLEAALAEYSQTIEKLNGLRREIFASCEKDVIRLALEVARKIIKREVTADDELILTMVKVALNRVAGHTQATVRVHPEDLRTLERHRAELPAAGPLNESLKLIEDPSIGRGGCVIEAENGTVDGRIEEQLREIENGLLG